MKLYKAIDKLDNNETFFLVYDDGSVAPMPVCDVSVVKRNVDYYARNKASRFADAVDPVLVAEW